MEMVVMTDKPDKRTRRSVTKKINGEAAMNKSIKNVKCGDLVWVKLHNSSWWPGQVVDENTVSANDRPKRATAGKVLVRLYGSYEYQYVDPFQSLLEFEQALGKYNGEYTGILKESLDEELHQLKIPKSNMKKMKTDGANRSDPPRGKISKPNKNKGQEMKLTCVVGEIEESMRKSPSQRRFKVMRALGLTAPPGSPFTLEGCISSASPGCISSASPLD